MLCSADFWEWVTSIADLMFAVPAIGKINPGSGGSCAAREMVQSVYDNYIAACGLDIRVGFEVMAFSEGLERGMRLLGQLRLEIGRTTGSPIKELVK